MQRSRLQFAATIVVAALSTLSALLLPGAGPAGASSLTRASGPASGAASDPGSGHPADEATEPSRARRTAEVTSWPHESVASAHGPAAAPYDTGASGPVAAMTEAPSTPRPERVAYRFVAQHAVAAEAPGTRTSGRAPPA